MRRDDIRTFYPYEQIVMDMFRRVNNSILECDTYASKAAEEKDLERQLISQNKRIITGDELELHHLFI